MGISPGWRNTCDANVTFQWVDVSEVQPDNYWVSAITDPPNQIVESNEANNDIIFSSNSFAVDRYLARQIPTQRSDRAIQLKSRP